MLKETRGRKPGTPKTGGRKKGVPNRNTEKRSTYLIATLEKNDFSPAAELIKTYRDARQMFENYDISGLEKDDHRHLYLKIALDAVKELASYSYPKFKSVEVKQIDPLEHMSVPEKIEALKKALSFLTDEPSK